MQLHYFKISARIPKRGGFWQALTDGEEDFDNKDLYNTVIREIKE